MPRGVRKQINYQEEIQNIDDQIRILIEKQAALTEQRSLLLEKQEQEELKSLSNLIHESGLSISDVSKLIQSKSSKSA